MKVRDWLNKLNSPMREWAIAEAKGSIDNECNDISDALDSFPWEESPQGYWFWAELHILTESGVPTKNILLEHLPTPKSVSESPINTMCKEIYEANRDKGFWDKERNVGEVLMLITSELGEAMEAHRKGRHANREGFKQTGDFKTNVKDTFEDELADAVIRIFDFAGGTNIDLDFHIREKLKFNLSRPYKHGNDY